LIAAGFSERVYEGEGRMILRMGASDVWHGVAALASDCGVLPSVA